MKHLTKSINANSSSSTLREKKAWDLNKERVQFIKALGDHINHMQRLRKVKHRGRKRGNRAANSDKYQALKRLQSVDTITSQSRPKYMGNTLFSSSLIVLFLSWFFFSSFLVHLRHKNDHIRHKISIFFSYISTNSYKMTMFGLGWYHCKQMFFCCCCCCKHSDNAKSFCILQYD